MILAAALRTIGRQATRIRRQDDEISRLSRGYRRAEKKAADMKWERDYFADLCAALVEENELLYIACPADLAELEGERP